MSNSSTIAPVKLSAGSGFMASIADRSLHYTKADAKLKARVNVDVTAGIASGSGGGAAAGVAVVGNCGDSACTSSDNATASHSAIVGAALGGGLDSSKCEEERSTQSKKDLRKKK